MKILRIAIVIFLFGLMGWAEKNEIINQVVGNLAKQLELNQEQENRLTKIVEAAQQQKQKDQLSYKMDALLLIKAANARKRLENADILDILNDIQKDKYKNIIKMDPFKRELFELTEGLRLSDDQAFTLEGILIDINNQWGGMSSGRTTPAGMGARTRRTRPPGMVSEKKMRSYRKKMQKKLQYKKKRAIHKILTKEQKILHKQILAENKKKKDN